MENTSKIALYGKGIIKLLNDYGFRIVHINNEFYSISDFERPDKNNDFYLISGKDITEIVETHGSSTPASHTINSIIQSIDALPLIEREYSSSYSVVVFCASKS